MKHAHLQLYSFNIPSVGRVIILSSSLENAVKSAENYFRIGLSVPNMKQFAKCFSYEKTLEYLDGGVIGEDGIFRSQSKLNEEMEALMQELFDD